MIMSFVQEFSSDSLFNILQNNIVLDRGMGIKKYSNDIIGFLQKNRYEIHQQVLSRFMIHHHNFILSPVNEISLKRDYKEINAQYGLGGAIIINKILLSFGGVSLQSWLKLCYSFYLLYFAAFIGVVSLITKTGLPKEGASSCMPPESVSIKYA